MKRLFSQMADERENASITVVRDIAAELEKFRLYMRNKPMKDGRRRKTCTASTIRSQTRMINAVVKKYGLDFSEDWIDVVRDGMEHEGLNKAVQSNYLNALENMFNANGHPIVIAKPIPVQRMMSDPRFYHTADDINRMLILAQPMVQDRALLSTLWGTACRASELSYLYVEDYVPDGKGHAFIRIADRGNGVKDKEERRIPIQRQTIADIDRWLRHREHAGLTPDKHPFLFINQTNGDQLSYERIYAITRRYGEEVGIVTAPHRWRHSRISYLLNDRNVPPTIVQKIAGHASLTMTLKYVTTPDATVARWIHGLDER